MRSENVYRRSCASGRNCDGKVVEALCCVLRVLNYITIN